MTDATMKSRDRRVMFERAYAALAAVVRVEYGEHYTLSHIAETWGEGITPEQLAAFREVEGLGREIGRA